MSPATPHRLSRAPARDVRAAVDRIVSDRTPTLGDQKVADSVRESWERCVRYGLEPDDISPAPVGDSHDAARLIDVVSAVLESREGPLRDSEVCLSLTDAEGVILKQWVGNPVIMRFFEQYSIVPGFSVAETTIGNSSGSTLITRMPTLVRGPEHFAPQFSFLTSAGNVITHPITKRVVGTLNLTCRFVDTSPMAIAWVCEMVTDIERHLLETSTASEHLLLNRFLHENRDSRHAVIAVSAQTAIANVAATKLMGSVDRARLWSYASTCLADPIDANPTIAMSDGSMLRVHRSAVVGSGDSLGVVLRLTRMEGGQPQRADVAAELPGLAGSSRRWTSMRQRLDRIGSSPVLLVGEAGVGKRSIARAMTVDEGAVIDVSRSGQIVDDVQAAVAAGPKSLTLLRLDALPSEHAMDLAGTLHHMRSDIRLLATSRRSPASGIIDVGLLDLFYEVVPVPHLKDRAEDIAAIVASLTERHIPGSRTVHWMPEALHALTRRDWPENVRSLDRLVKHVLDATSREYIGLRDLPAHVVSRAGRRHLVGLERMEAEAILQALRDSEWNKHQAADALGIARSTLYRKMQALGIAEEASF